MLRFRDLRDEDLPAVKAIDRVSFDLADQYADAFYARWPFDRMLHAIVGVDDANAVIAYALLAVDTIPVKLRSLAVHPGHRNRGYGEDLLRHVIAETDAAIELLVEPSNETALRLYERLGFEFAPTAPPPEVPSRKVMIRVRP